MNTRVVRLSAYVTAIMEASMIIDTDKVLELIEADAIFKLDIIHALDSYNHRNDRRSYHANRIAEDKDRKWLGGCNKCHKWLCEASPTLVCHYNYRTYGCQYCGKPEERK